MKARSGLSNIGRTQWFGVLGEPDRDDLYAEVDRAALRFGTVQVTIPDADWIATGEGSFHDTVVSRPMVPIPLADNSTS